MLHFRHFVTSLAFYPVVLLSCLINISAEAQGDPNGFAPPTTVAVPTTQYSFEKVTSMAIAMEQANSWNTQTGKESIALLANDATALQNLKGMRKLLGEDLSGIPDLFGNRAKSPTTEDVQRALTVLSASPFTMATNALTVVYRGAGQAERVKAWVSIPAAKRAPLDAYMLQRYPTGGQNRRMLAEGALQMYQTAAPNAVPPAQSYLDLALQFGIYPDGPINFESALNLAQDRNINGALQVARALATASPIDAGVQRAAADFVFRYVGVDAGVTQFQTSLKMLPEPMTRDMRLGFLDQLAKKASEVHDQPSAGALEKMASADDPLLAGDALQVTNHFPEAAAKFSLALKNTKSTTAVRLDAWTGLLDNDPSAALTAAPALLDEIEKQPVESRSALRNWLGWQLWNVCARDLAPPRRRQRNSWHTPHLSLDAANGGAAVLAPLMQRLVNVDPLTILTPDGRHADTNSLRVPAAMFFTLQQQPEKAVEILTRRLDYQIPPPDGGWKIFDGTPDKDAMKSRPAVSPSDAAESSVYLNTLLDAITRSAESTQVTPPLLAALARDLAVKLKDATDATTQLARIHDLSTVLAYSAIGLNPMPPGLMLNQPPPTPAEVDMVCYRAIDDAFRRALAIDAVAKQGHILLREGFVPAFRIASNPKLLDALFALLTTAIDRYKATGADDKTVAYEVTFVMGSMNVRKLYDLKPYALKLNQTYLLPK